MIDLSKLLKKHSKNEDNKRLFFNFIFLSILQGANYIFPLITFPYLVRVLGVEKFGLIAFANVTAAYFNILTDYGFNLTATREIAVYRYDKDKINEIYSSVMIVKTVLFFVSFLLLCTLVFSFKKFSKDWQVYFFAFGFVAGQYLFPVWFFQGKEKMKYVTFFNLLAKTIFTLAIFLFVKNRDHYLMVPFLNSVASITSGIVSQAMVFAIFKIKFKWQKVGTLMYYIKNAYYVFISNVAISLYTVSTTFILGLFTNNTFVGYYASADKIVQAVKSLMTPISQTLYPFMSKKVSESKDKSLNIIRKLLLIVSIFSFLCSICILIFSEEIVMIILGKEYLNSVLPLRIMSILPFIVALSNIFGLQVMLTFNRKKAFSNILILASVLNIICSFVFVPLLKHIGSAISVTIVETFVTLTMFTYLQLTGLPVIELKRSKINV